MSSGEVTLVVSLFLLDILAHIIVSVMVGMYLERKARAHVLTAATDVGKSVAGFFAQAGSMVSGLPQNGHEKVGK